MTYRTRLVTASLSIAVPVLFNLFFVLLQPTFDYPNILREPAGEVLRRFDAVGATRILIRYGFALTPALFLLAAVLPRRFFPAGTPLLALATPLAVVASLVQLLGLVRWPFLVPELARTYLDSAADEATRASLKIAPRPGMPC